MKKIVTAYFSPTGNSKKYSILLAEKIGLPFEQLDFTKKENRQNNVTFSKGDVVIFSAPVYAGRLPNINLFENVTGNGAYAVCMVTYGNREYDDALLELKDKCEQRGFHVIAAAAWIGKHTYSDVLGVDRPKEKDILKIENLATYIQNGIEKQDFFQGKHLEVKGNPEYCEYKALSFVPQPNEKCSRCGSCVRKCPVGAIDSKTLLADAEKCISCFACVKGCTKHARKTDNAFFPKLVEKLEKSLKDIEKEAEIFLLK